MPKILKKLTLSLLLVFSIFILASCSKKTEQAEPLSRSELLMGTVVDIKLYDSDNEVILNTAFDK
ncbi:FAD:protein FMN transferase, partial [Clostridium sp. HCS.1]